VTLRRRLIRKLWRFRQPFSNARSTWQERESIELELELGSCVGLGEAAPLPGFSPETLSDAERALESVSLDRLSDLIERCCAEPGSVVPALATLSSIVVPSARFALESAVLGLVATRRQKSLAELLCAQAATPTRAWRELAQLVDVAAVEEHARSALGEGYTTLKLKLNTPLGFERELDALLQLRSRFGDSVRLRLDANGSFTREGFAQACRTLAALGPEFIEEPLPKGEVRLAQTLLPIALDESLSAPDSLVPAELSRENVRVLVLKPTLLGGICATLAFVERAQALGLDWLLSHTFEGVVGYRALTALALALPEPRFAHGLGYHAALTESPEALGIHRGKLGQPA
jgi:o-succinylbenzoate synthase